MHTQLLLRCGGVLGQSWQRKEERKAAAEARKSRDRTGKASEMSPLVRRLDGSFAFRNKGQESANAALKKERRDAVKDSLFKFLDSL